MRVRMSPVGNNGTTKIGSDEQPSFVTAYDSMGWVLSCVLLPIISYTAANAEQKLAFTGSLPQSNRRRPYSSVLHEQYSGGLFFPPEGMAHFRLCGANELPIHVLRCLR